MREWTAKKGEREVKPKWSLAHTGEGSMMWMEQCHLRSFLYHLKSLGKKENDLLNFTVYELRSSISKISFSLCNCEALKTSVDPRKRNFERHGVTCLNTRTQGCLLSKYTHPSRAF